MVAIEFLDVEVGPLREMQRFGEALDDAGDANLVRHLGELPGAGRADQIAGAGIRGDDFFGAGERGGIAAAHHREHAVLGAGLAARHRRVDEVKAARLGFGVKLARDLRRCGGVIDDDRAFARAGENAIRAEHHLAHVVVVADAGHDEVLAFGGGLRRRRGFAAILRDPFVGLCGGAVDRPYLVAGLGLEVPGHRVAHDARPTNATFAIGFSILGRASIAAPSRKGRRKEDGCRRVKPGGARIR